MNLGSVSVCDFSVSARMRGGAKNRQEMNQHFVASRLGLEPWVSCVRREALLCLVMTLLYTLSHTENDRDVNAYSRQRPLLSHAKKEWCIRMRLAACILRRTQWRHGRSWVETKYSYSRSILRSPYVFDWLHHQKLTKHALTDRLFVGFF